MEVVADVDQAQTVPEAIRPVLSAPGQLVERSKEIARDLYAVQSRVN